MTDKPDVQKAIEKVKDDIDALCGTSIWQDEGCGDPIAKHILSLAEENERLKDSWKKAYDYIIAYNLEFSAIHELAKSALKEVQP